jgi:predicted PurR-regulated permease PerM
MGMSAAAHWAIVFVVLVNTLFVGGIAVVLWVLYSRLSQLVEQAQPLVGRAEEVLGRVEELTGKVEERVTGVLDTADRVVRDVSQKVETTTSIAEETISQPLIGAASLMAGITRGLSKYREMTEKGDGKNNG